MIEVYLIIFDNSYGSGPTWIGPMDSISIAKTLNKEIDGIGNIASSYGPLKVNRIISPSEYRKGLSLEP